MTTLRIAAQQSIALICSARLCEVNSMSSRQEMLRLMIEATDTLRAALEEPVHPAIPLENSREAADAIEATLAEYGHPTNPVNAARAGWRAARLYTTPTQPPAEPVQEPVAYSEGRTLHWHKGKGVSDAQLFAAPPQRPTELVGIVSNLVKGGVVWQRWPADMPDGTRLFGEVQP